ncbi:putative bifunctional diguanylate cyclase/phosphodiesterase [Noviherbaspirillum humi]|uniref:putative bifunctional diguanylate cyclase/phosphodiesterase n=1 Tax=Noviherbaspirillum humi TaxID=1688639 RepID=UPI001596018D|nr:GGDEF domain-containing phosphodiesterase [Noviherbaspirillum humi]
MPSDLKSVPLPFSINTEILSVVPQGIIITDVDGLILFANAAFLAITGYSEQEIFGRNCRFLQGPLTDRSTVQALRGALDAQQEFSAIILNYRKDGTPFWNECSLAPLSAQANGSRVTHFIGTQRDVSERIYAEQALRQSEQRLKLALQGGSLGLWDWYVTTGLLTVNDRWKAMLGIPLDTDAVTLDTWAACVHPEDMAKLEKIIDEVILNPSGQYFEVEVRARHAAGHWVWILDKGAVVERAEDGSPVRVTGTHLDITERKQADEEMHRLAYYDTMTGLPNRRLLMDRITQALAAATRSAQTGALLFIDLDDFKQINDARGHAVGDALLMQVAQRLSILLRTGDTVARLGGDEFVVLVTNLEVDIDKGWHKALGVAERIHSALSLPFLINGATYSSGASIGITLFPQSGCTADDLLREADTAMYRAKSNGGSGTAFFEQTMHAEAEQRLAIEHALKESVAGRLFELYAQPQVDRLGNEIGCELLLRWTHPVHGSISPLHFIPIAEATGDIIPLGAWVVEQACRLLAQLQEAGIERTVSVNVSPRQFRHVAFVDGVRSMLQQTGAPSGRLIFEVTEGLLIENLEETAARMRELTAMGVRFSIDDFGTGYSSLAYLKRLPIHELKIDRSFVRDLPDDASDKAIMQSILSIAHHLQLQVVAEGVETAAQADLLIESGCTIIQGYFFGRPRPVQEWFDGAVGALQRSR